MGEIRNLYEIPGKLVGKALISIAVKMHLKESGSYCKLDSAGLEETLEPSCENRNEPWSSIKGGEFLD
jgi:hypothetical protein